MTECQSQSGLRYRGDNRVFWQNASVSNTRKRATAGAGVQNKCWNSTARSHTAPPLATQSIHRPGRNSDPCYREQNVLPCLERNTSGNKRVIWSNPIPSPSPGAHSRLAGCRHSYTAAMMCFDDSITWRGSATDTCGGIWSSWWNLTRLNLSLKRSVGYLQGRVSFVKKLQLKCFLRRPASVDRDCRKLMASYKSCKRQNRIN